MNADTFKIHTIFPTAVATTDNLQFPVEEHNTILNSKFSIVPQNGPFYVSNNKYILDTVPLLKKWIQDQVDIYSRDVLGSDKLKFTQSWAIKHQNEPQRIFTHSHANSIVSGSYYIDAPDGSEALTLVKMNYPNGPYLEYKKNSDNKPWLWDQIKYRAYTGRLILFPSNLLHGVLGNEVTDQRRCVLAFNTWFANPIGSKEELTYLD
jgi:uncharacterized protein (TIGR02466 family)